MMMADDDQDVDHSNEMTFDYRYASIRINNGNPDIMDLATISSLSDLFP